MIRPNSLYLRSPKEKDSNMDKCPSKDALMLPSCDQGVPGRRTGRRLYRVAVTDVY